MLVWEVFFQGLTWLGSADFFMAALALIYWFADKRLGVRLSFVCGLSMLGNIYLKDLFQWPRPWPGNLTVKGWGFPSGHAQGAATFWGFLAAGKSVPWALAGVMIAGVALSRVYLGVHYPGDVIGGTAFGLAFALAGSLVAGLVPRSAGRGVRVGAALPAVGVLAGGIAALTVTLAVSRPDLFPLPAWPGEHTYYREGDFWKTLGALSGMFIGYGLEKRYVGFVPLTGPWTARLVSGTTGLAVLLALRLVLKGIFPPGLASEFLRYVILSIWVFFVWPWLLVPYSSKQVRGS